MRQRFLLVAAAFVPIAAAGAVHGCSGEPKPEDFCGWLGRTETNCYRAFHEDLGAACGSTTPADVAGTFATREMLDTCILTAKGGSVTLDPPIDLTKLPPEAPLTLSFVGPDGSPCGTVAYSSQFSFSITIDPPPDGGAAGSGTTGAGGGGTASDTKLQGGTFSAVATPDRDTVDVSCPPRGVLGAAETHRFNLLQINACPAFADIAPQAILELDPGSVQRDGSLRLRIHYPPPTDTWDGGASPASADGVVKPDIVTYFECRIPGAPLPCQDGTKNGLETDQDCGGPADESGCPIRCQVGQACLCNGDCASSALCGVDAMSGTRQCMDTATVTPAGGIACGQGQACCTSADCNAGLTCVAPGVCSKEAGAAFDCGSSVDAGTDGP